MSTNRFEEHANWTPNPSRPDPIEVLQSSDSDRIPDLLPIRYNRMKKSPFAFFRGGAAIMAGDLAGLEDLLEREAELVQSCGDAHLLNFGGFATPERNLIFDLSDFDETFLAPWEWDVKRLAASLVIAGRNRGFKPKACRKAAVAGVRGYRKRMMKLAKMPVLKAWYARVNLKDVYKYAHDKKIEEVLKEAVDKARSQAGAYADFICMCNGKPHIMDAKPLIYHMPATPTFDFDKGIEQASKKYRESLDARCQKLFGRFELHDIAAKVVGVGSVGKICAIALYSDGKNPLVLQIKEAWPSVLDPGKKSAQDQGERVVAGQRLMQAASDIFLGSTKIEINGKTKYFYVRQLRDMKIEPMIDEFDAKNLARYGGLCGTVLAQGHARSGSAKAIADYLGESDDFDKAVGDFAIAYADQNERDHERLKKEIKKGGIKIQKEEKAEKPEYKCQGKL